MAHGGSAIARRDGKAFFIDGALPGEVVEADIELDKGSWGRARLQSVVTPSPARIAPQCRHFDVRDQLATQTAAMIRRIDGDVLEMHITTLRGKPGGKIFKFDGKAVVGDEVAAEAEFAAFVDFQGG